jgi:methylase of polypeptide subunit release factors
MKSRLPFRNELPPTRLVRDYVAAGGSDPSAYASALLEVARRMLDATPDFAPAADGCVAPELRALAENALALFPVSRREGVTGALTPEWLGDLHRLARGEADHKRHGRWYTARPIARYMARRALAIAGLRRPLDTVTVLDPACGCGALAVPMLEEIVAFQQARAPDRPRADLVAEAVSHFTLADVDEHALEIAVLRLRIAAARLADAPDAPLLGSGADLAAMPRTFHGDTLTASPETLIPGGADIVVMNPPYLGARYFEALPHPERARADLRRVFGWNDDLYAHFLHRAWDWLRPGGAVCAITSDTFLTIPSKARTRDTLRRHALCEIVRVPPSAFAAAVNTCITLAVRAAPELFDRVSYLDARSAPEAAWDALEREPTPDGVQRYSVPSQVYADPNAPFFLPTPRAVALYRRYWRVGGDGEEEGISLAPLGEVATARDAGINSGNVRHKLFFADYRPGLRRLIQGRQLERYVVRWDSPAAKFRWVDIAYQPDPAVRGIGRGGERSAHGETWGFRGDLSLHAEPERLFLRQTEDDLFAAFLRQDPADPVYTDNTLFTLLLTDAGREHGLTYPYLLGLLNSAFLNELYHLLSQEAGRSQAQVKVGYVNRLPIVIPTEEQRRAVEAATLEAMDAAAAGKPVTAHQWHIDTLVEALYTAAPAPTAS